MFPPHRWIVMFVTSAPLLGACRGGPPVAPADPTGFTIPAGGYVCSNQVLVPPGGFRMVVVNMAGAAETTGVFQNRYTVPQRPTDTVVVGGLMVRYNASTDPRYCQTLLDSLAHHLPGARGYLPLGG